jgi:hypothetical protein
MRIGIRACFGLLFFSVMIACARAELRVARSTVDLGKLRTGKVLKHSCAFVNAGPDAVEIVEARASCGCLAPQLQKQTYRPGEEGELFVEVNTLGQPAGRNSWHVKLSYRQADKLEETTLRLSAELIREIEVEPTAITMLTGTEIRREITVTEMRERPLHITDVRCSSPKLSGQIAGVSKDAAGRRVTRIGVKLAGDCPEGRHDEVIALYTDDPDYPELKVPITILKQHRTRIAALPNRVELTAALGQALPSRVLLLRAPENQTVIVDRITADHASVVTSWAPGPGPAATVKVTVDRSRMPGAELQSTIHIHVREPFKEILSIPVTCTLQ